jgi:Cu(I)/Ag(I) efflux system membrane fusion protein
MGEPDTSPVPKKDSMGMDYIPVYERDAPAASGVVTVDTAKVQRAGVRIEAAARRTLERQLAAPGVVKFNEAQTAVSSPRVEGWIERVYVGATGQAVKAGQPLVDIYSPELLQTQREYFLARDAQRRAPDGGGIGDLADGALLRLRNLGVSDAQVRQIANSTEPRRTITISSPITGVVSEKVAAAGQRVMPGDILYRFANSDNVWVVAKVFERDLPAIKIGSRAAISIGVISSKEYRGEVSFISPALDPATRTADVRIDVPNDDAHLKSDMLATVRFDIPRQGDAITVPNSAIIDSGTRQVVFVSKDNGSFEPREVSTGGRSDEYTVITKGVSEGERVVVGAAFLIDSESNLRAALQSFAAPDPKAEQKR